MINSCPVCSTGDAQISDVYRGVHSAFKGLHRAQCRSCGLSFASPMPDEDDLNDYNFSYFEAAHGGTPTNKTALAFFKAIGRLRKAYVETYLLSQQIVAGKVLEIGPGPGFFASSWLEKYPHTTYLAKETDVSCHPNLNSIGVQVLDDILEVTADVSVDLVVMSHVLEHVADPRSFVIDGTRCLRNGGVLFVEVPCLDYMHKPIDEPHLLFFDKMSMEHLLRSAGFENVELAYFGQEIQSLSSESIFRSKLMAVRSKLIALGVLWPFGRKRKGMETLLSSLERASVAPFKAHLKSSEPTWWLRAVARKKTNWG